MPRTQLQIPTAAPIRAKLPTKQYPHLKSVINELDFACQTCSSAMGQTVHVNFMDAVKDPIRGPEDYSTVFALLCPDCRTAPQDGPYITMGMIDLLMVPANYKRPARSISNRNETGLGMDEEGDEDVQQQEVAEKRTPRLQKKKTSDLNPATRGKKAKGAIKATSAKKARNAEVTV